MTTAFVARVTAKAMARVAARAIAARRMATAMAAAMAAAQAAATPTAAFASPDLREGRTAGVLTVYPDHARRGLFYYPPGELAIAVTQSGGPDVHLLHARYTGSAASGDRGTKMVRSIFTLRLVMNGPTAVELAAARRDLAARIGGTVGAPIELRPLPIRRMESVVIYAAAAVPAAPAASASTAVSAATPALEAMVASPATVAAVPATVSAAAAPMTPSTQDASEAGTLSPAVLPAGHAEETDAALPREGYWTERFYTIGLDAADAQLLSDALERGGLALSVGYAFLADGIASDRPLQELTGSPELVDALKKRLVASDEKTSGPHVVRAGAIGVTVDVKRWPRIVQRIDINDAAPPGYAALDVYCYDFNQDGESPLYEKQIEIDAAGVGGRRVQMKTTFGRAQPDLFARSLRFPVAVRLDAPYRFRIHEIAQDGSEKTSEWRERTSWTELLDVTTVKTTGEVR